MLGRRRVSKCFYVLERSQLAVAKKVVFCVLFSTYIGEGGVTSQHYSRVVQQGGGRRGVSLARFANEKNRGSRIMDLKMSFSRITKISK